MELEATHVQDTSLYSRSQDILHPFAWDELMCEIAGNGGGPAVHIWQHPQAFVMGLRDRKLPYAEEAMQWLRELGYSVGVRNSGGAAVPLDTGVVNVSVVMPLSEAQGQLHFHEDFKRMVRLIQASIRPWAANAESGEIEGSYCPGEYDVSIQGLKFCGIAQRRRLKAYIVSAFVVVEGKGDERAHLVREFYNRASGGLTEGQVNADHPLVEAGSMASLQELIGVPDSSAYISALEQALLAQEGFLIGVRSGETHAGLLPNQSQIELMMQQLRTRYDK